MRMWIYAIIVMLFGVTAGTAAAASPIVGYNGITVVMSRDAGLCGLQASAVYEGYLRERFVGIPLPLDETVPAHARLALSAEPFSSIGNRCVVLATLTFYVQLEQDDVEVLEAVTNRELVVAVFEQIRVLPVVLYEDGEFSVSEGTNAHTTAIKLIDDLASQFGATQ